MLRVNLRALEHGSVEIAGSLAPDDPRLDGLDVELAKPVKVTGQLAGGGPRPAYSRWGMTTTPRRPPGRRSLRLGYRAQRDRAGSQPAGPRGVDPVGADVRVVS